MYLEKLRAYGKIFASARYDKVPDLFRLLLKRPAILMGVAAYESALVASSKADSRLKMLASIKTSSLVGCPF
jgi:alkylhydroperoxidase family enzyme